MSDSGPLSSNFSKERAVEAFRRLRQRLDVLEQRAREPIAIVGIGCRFPGGISSPEALWRALCDGRDAVGPVPAERWRADAFDDPRMKWGAFLDAPDAFDAEFFGITPREARVMDPQHRLVLEVAWEALEDAGLAPAQLGDARGGVFLASMTSDYVNVVGRDPEKVEPHMTSGNGLTFAPNRISHFFDFHGPSVMVDTACSGSLVTLHLASQSLREHECDVALAGGVTLLLTPHVSVGLSKFGALSPTGRCHAFSAAADGYVRGEGCGVLVLKRLADAVKARDHIYAVVLGSAVNHSGKTSGLTVPSGDAQYDVIAEAWRRAGTTADDLDYIEAHGTGTPLGDPIEVAGLARALEGRTRAAVPIGTIKSNFGHMEAAAGVGGVIKTALAIEYGLIPQSLHFDTPNPRIDFASKLRVATSLETWSPGPQGRTAGVSSFGMGGTNAHVVLGSAPERDQPVTSRARTNELHARPLLLSAKSAEALRTLATQWADAIDGLPSPVHVDLAVANAALRRAQHAHRVAVLSRAPNEIGEALRSWSRGEGDDRVLAGPATLPEDRVVFVFCGQGAQWWGMGRGLLDSSSVFRDAIEPFTKTFRSLSGIDVIEELQRGEAESRLFETRVGQPALFAVQVGLSAIWRSWGLEPAAVIGHSVGEIAAAHVAGALSLDDAALLLHHRGRLLQRSHGEGAMLALDMTEEEAAEFASKVSPRLELATLNGPHSVVLAGPNDDIEAAERAAGDKDVFARRLQGHYAFHSAQMDAHVEELEVALAALVPHPPEIPFISTAAGEPAPRLDAAYYSRQIRRPVRFADGVRRLLEDGYEIFLEVGPHPLFRAVIEEMAASRGREAHVFGSLDRRRSERESLSQAFALLHVHGVPLDLRAVYAGDEPVAAMQLPRHPFSKRRHWFDAARAPSSTRVELLQGTQDHRPMKDEVTPAASLDLAHSAPRAPTLSVEVVSQRLREIVAEVFASTPSAIAPDADLLALGADSVMLLEIGKKIQTEFGVTLSMREIFRSHRKLDALSAFIATKASPESAVTPTSKSISIVPAAPVVAPTPAPRVVPVISPRPNAPSILQPANSQALKLDQDQLLALRHFLADYQRRTPRSKELADRNRLVLADPRASAGFRQLFKEAVYPLHSERALGSRIWDIDGNEYIDLSMGFGSNLFGHSPPVVMSALRRELDRGLGVGPNSRLAGEVASRITELTGAERVAFFTTGTEAMMVAARIARTFSMREKVVVFTGAYHGHFDGLVAMAGEDGVNGVAGFPGISNHAAAGTIVLPWADPSALATLEQHAGEIAAVLVEPVQSRRPDIQPADFLQALRALTKRLGILLVFDEMITGFRCHPRGAQGWFNVDADVAVYGKSVAGGMPIGVVTGRADVLDCIDGGVWRFGDDSGPAADKTFVAGTFNKHPLTMAAANAVLTELKRGGGALQTELNTRTQGLVVRLNAMFMDGGFPIRVKSFSSLFRFDGNPMLVDLLVMGLGKQGVYVPEIRNCFISTAHTNGDLDAIERAVGAALGELAELGLVRPAAGPRVLTETAFTLSAWEGDPEAEIDVPVTAASPGRVTPLPKRSRVVVTGATGFIGRYLVRDLIQSGAGEVVCLVRGRDDVDAAKRMKAALEEHTLEVDAARLRVVAADLAAPTFGLDASRLDGILSGADAVFHAAAYTNYIANYDRVRPINVEALRELLRRVRAPLHFVSTHGVFPPRPAEVEASEDELPTFSEPLRYSGYGMSKWVADRIASAVVRDAKPLMIYRMGDVGGHAGGGSFSPTSWIDQLMRLCMRIGYVPEVDYLVDLVPVDFVSQAIVNVAATYSGPGRAVHLGGEAIPIVALAARLRGLGYDVGSLDRREWLRRARFWEGDSAFMVAVEQFDAGGWTHPPRLGKQASEPLFAGTPIAYPALDGALLRAYAARWTGRPSESLPRSRPDASVDVVAPASSLRARLAARVTTLGGEVLARLRPRDQSRSG